MLLVADRVEVACQKPHTSLESEAWWRLCGKVKESVAQSCLGAVRWHRVSTYPDMALL